MTVDGTQLSPAAAAAAALRPEAELMRPERLYALAPSSLSFTRSLIRKMVGERWRVSRVEFEVDGHGEGDAVYRVEGGGRVFDFVVFSFAPAPPDSRTDRIIGQHWDVFAALFEGEASREQIEATRRELPKLYAGRAPAGTLVWCRSNRSLRIFESVVEALSEGRQPDPAALAEVCYIVRNTGLDANGTFGTRSFLSYEDDHPLRIPYHAQMLAAYLMREFGADLAEGMAAQRGAGAARLRRDIRRFVGLGNSSGLGLVLFANNHPLLIGRWLELREQCLARAKARRARPGSPEVERLAELLRRCIRFGAEDRVRYHTFSSGPAIAEELELAAALVAEFAAGGTVAGVETETPWAAIGEQLSDRVGAESLERFHGLLIDLDPEGADRLQGEHITSEVLEYLPEMPVSELRELVREQYGWALEVDLEQDGAYRYFWYKSEEAEEPRRGIRGGEVSGFDLGLDVPGDLQGVIADLERADGATPVGRFLLDHPVHRAAVVRVQGLRDASYHTVRANIMDDDFVPARVIRLFNASMYGLDKTRDVEFSEGRWVRGVMFHGAPCWDELADWSGGDWPFPAEPRP
ncbi:MAG: hypothetical protein QOE56_1820 [Solirubrobacterales bacterium]|jgi:hypothetical protein|nr:hypothetical protein [Solirubrobacterales bacterium]